MNRTVASLLLALSLGSSATLLPKPAAAAEPSFRPESRSAIVVANQNGDRRDRQQTNSDHRDDYRSNREIRHNDDSRRDEHSDRNFRRDDDSRRDNHRGRKVWIAGHYQVNAKHHGRHGYSRTWVPGHWDYRR